MKQQEQISHYEGEEAYQPDILLAEQKDDAIFNTQLLEPAKDLFPTSGTQTLFLFRLFFFQIIANLI